MSLASRPNNPLSQVIAALRQLVNHCLILIMPMIRQDRDPYLTSVTGLTQPSLEPTSIPMRETGTLTAKPSSVAMSTSNVLESHKCQVVSSVG